MNWLRLLVLYLVPISCYASSDAILRPCFILRNGFEVILLYIGFLAFAPYRAADYNRIRGSFALGSRRLAST
ncbi:hypothetical protein BJ878DRAFT_500382 [Calycina marina]|uniref:Uncharacterized protein n=1 Tax=Calycina marina TaxID=1763456 RepID=A0A9P7Z503_9HELO|nr:hypothetical protein BJ878DRAFT_500382 [Calycina marina]